MGSVGLHKKGEVSLEQLIEEQRSRPESRKAGAVATFLGIVREEPVKGGADNVEFLEYEAYEQLAVGKLHEIRDQMMMREGIVDVSIHHVIDRVGVGEESLYVVVMATHRRYVFSVLQDAVDRVKFEAQIWKKEFTRKEAYWVSASGEAESPRA